MASGKHVLYSVTRDILTPNQMDFYQVTFHSIVLAFVLSILFYTRTESILSSGLAFLLPIIPVVALLWNYERDDYGDNILLLQFEDYAAMRLAIGYGVASLIYIIGAEPIFGFDITKLSLLAPVPLYWTAVWYFFGTRYSNDKRKYFVHTQGPTRRDWERASVSMERGHDNRMDGNVYEAYYHYSRAEKIYQDLNARESRETYKTVSNLHEKAAYAYKKSLVQPTHEEAKKWFDRGESNIRQSNDVANSRICDECGERKHVNNVFQYISRSDGEFGESIYCRSCDASRKTNSTGASRGNSTNSSSNTSSGTSRGSSNHNSGDSFKGAKTGRTVEPETKDSSLPPRELIDGTVTIEWSKEVLSIDEEFNERDVESSFREQVKIHHPDSGGNTEDFKKVKEARKRLLSEVD